MTTPTVILPDEEPAAAPPSPNGMAAAAPPPAPPTALRMPRITEWMPIPGYDGYQALIWANAPQRVLRDLISGDDAKVGAALRALIWEHNGWGDHEGHPLPPASDPAFWDSPALPRHLLIQVLQAVSEAITRPNSPRPRTAS